MKLHETTTVEFYDLSFVEEEDSWIVGRPETAVYIRTSEEGKSIIELLGQGCDVVHVERHFPELNVRHFIWNLIHDGFVRRIEDQELHDVQRERFQPLFNRVRAEQVRWLFHPVMQLLYLAIIATGGFLLVTNTRYLPVPGDVFFTDYLMLLLPVSVVTSWLLLFFHEMGHYLAAKSHGLLTRFGITNRYYYIVAITDVTNVYSLPRNERFRILYGGMVVDALMLSLSVILIHLLAVPWLDRYLAFIVLFTFLGLTWQFLFFLRTDLYFVIQNILGIHNLNEKTRGLLKRLVRAGRAVHFASTRERRATYGYAPFFVLGYAVLTFLLVYYSVPIMYEVIVRTFSKLFVFTNPLQFVDAVIFLLITLLNWVIFGTVMIHHRFRRPVMKLVALTLLLMGEFLLAFLLTASIVMATEQPLLLGFTVFLVGTLFTIPVHYLWRKAHPGGMLRWELGTVLAVIFVFYLFVYRTLLNNFLEAAEKTVPGDLLLFVFVIGIAASAAYLWGDHKTGR